MLNTIEITGTGEKTPAWQVCGAGCEDDRDSAALSCKLSTPELRQRKETLIAEVRKKVLEKKELPDGYSYRFHADGQTLDQLMEFIKTERDCCPFFHFLLSIPGNQDQVWLHLTGPGNVKKFIQSELEL